MKQRVSSEANSCSAKLDKKIRNPKVPHHVYKGQPPDTILSLLSPIQVLRTEFCSKDDLFLLAIK
jgi:hypothetical protein